MKPVEIVALALRKSVAQSSGRPEDFGPMDDPFDPAELEIARGVLTAIRDELLNEDIAAAMECQFSTETQWKAAFDAALAA